MDEIRNLISNGHMELAIEKLIDSEESTQDFNDVKKMYGFGSLTRFQFNLRLVKIFNEIMDRRENINR